MLATVSVSDVSVDGDRSRCEDVHCEVLLFFDLVFDKLFDLFG